MLGAMKPGLYALACAALLATAAPRATAFTHTVQKNETLAQIAERTYGRIQYEKILVAAKALDAKGGSPTAAGHRPEAPAPDHYRINASDPWRGLAKHLPGVSERRVVLAQANNTMPGIPPAEGAEIIVPYN